MSLPDELERIADAAAAYASDGEQLSGILAAEPLVGGRVYLCAFGGGGRVSWLALDDGGTPVAERERLREAVSLVALCEVAEESAGGGELDELLSRLVALRLTENPPGIDEAEQAVLGLQRAIGTTPRVASTAYLDAVGAAAKRLETALGETTTSPFAEAMQTASGPVQALIRDVEANYKIELA